MAKISVRAREVKKAKLVKKYAEKRKLYKEKGDYVALDKLPRLSSPVKLRNRCNITGRGRGYIKDFGVSRIVFRDLALNGILPGVKKSS